MAYRKPSDTEILEAIRDTLQRHGVVNSQRKMTEFVLKELRRHDSDYSVGEERVRRLAIDNGLAKVEIHARESDKKTSARDCPVCGGKTFKLKNETVYGGTVTVGYKCKTCGFWTGLKQRVPTRYVFCPK
jgi:DNA-directed RNA polymerase subunit RPC12/RpoP